MKANSGKWSNTQVFFERGLQKVQLYSTVILSWDANKVYVSAGRYNTVLTRRRINQASEFYGLGVRVRNVRGELVVSYKGADYKVDETNFIGIDR